MIRASAILAALVLASCPAPRCSRVENGACWYGEAPTEETRARVAAVLPLLPADPWPCIQTVGIGFMDPRCPKMNGCYLPDSGEIYSNQAAFHHEIAHAAFECATGSPDPKHASPLWREIDAIK